MIWMLVTYNTIWSNWQSSILFVFKALGAAFEWQLELDLRLVLDLFLGNMKSVSHWDSSVTLYQLAFAFILFCKVICLVVWNVRALADWLLFLWICSIGYVRRHIRLRTLTWSNLLYKDNVCRAIVKMT